MKLIGFPSVKNKLGWPWTEATPPLPPTMPDGSPWPKISIVTPSFNQGQYIEETIRSVLLQGYPNLEYIIIDGGSTDGSVEIIKKYEPWLTYWVSEPDRGQSHAINKGWKKATGEIIAYLNSDDVYYPQSFKAVAENYSVEYSAIMGNLAFINSVSEHTGTSCKPIIPSSDRFDLSIVNPDQWLLPQASTFWTSATLEKAGKWVREDLHFTMDRELFYRSCKQGGIKVIEDTLAGFRIHGDNKSINQTMKMYHEDAKALRYSFDKDFRNNLYRIRNSRIWLARGHLFASNRSANRIPRIWHLFLSTILRPSQLFQKKHIKRILKAILPMQLILDIKKNSHE